MMPASNNGVGMNLCFPDVCVSTPPVPPVPLPWPNIAMSCMAAPFSPNIYIGFMPALTMGSTIPMTSGDELGVPGGRIKLLGAYTMGNPTIFINAMPAINLLCPTSGNAMNAPLGAVVMPSVTTTLFTDREALSTAGGGSLGLPELCWLDDAVSGTKLAASESPGQVVVRVDRFSRGLSTRVFNAVRGSDVAALVIDLRGCPGGDLCACLQLLDDFVPRGTLLGYREDAGGELEELRARQDDPYRFEVTVLVDERTASAAELFAGSLQALSRARVLGRRTAGKASVQAALPEPDRPGVRYATVAALRLPDGRSFAGHGIEPDGPCPEW